jgi:quinol monooxygenase YgiN
MMTGPFIFVATHRIKEGKLEEFKEDARSLAKAVQENEPQLLAFNMFLSQDEAEATVVQVHPDADSMLRHMEVANAHIRRSTDEQLETKEIQIYGPPNGAVLGMIDELTQAGVPISVKPTLLVGFTREPG